MAETPSSDIVRLEQAMLLRAASSGSAKLVLLIIANAAFLMVLIGRWRTALAWVIITCALVGATRLHARYRFPGAALNSQTAGRYIGSHIAITATTGLVWSGFAILTADPSSELQVMIATMMLTSISLGGLLPGSPHRGDYLVMASAAMLPFAVWLSLAAVAPIRFFSVGLVILFGVLVVASRRVHRDVVDAITARIREKNAAAERAMVSSIGHDLAQPLYAQRNYLEVLKRKAVDTSDAEIFRKIDQAQSSQEYLIGMLTQHERIQRDGFEPHIEQVDLVALVKGIIEEDFWVAQSAGSAPIHLSAAPVEAAVFTDGELVANALRNLISNAVKFTPADGLISVTIAVEPTTVVITVTDTGIGIVEEDQQRVFEPYFRIAQGVPYAGLGLGLSSVKRQMALLGGSVKLTSKLEQGTSVRLTIPGRADVR